MRVLAAARRSPPQPAAARRSPPQHAPRFAREVVSFLAFGVFFRQPIRVERDIVRRCKSASLSKVTKGPLLARGDLNLSPSASRGDASDAISKTPFDNQCARSVDTVAKAPCLGRCVVDAATWLFQCFEQSSFGRPWTGLVLIWPSTGGSFWLILGPFWPILAHFGPFWLILVLFGRQPRAFVRCPGAAETSK